MRALRPDPIDRVLARALGSARETAHAGCPQAAELASWYERSLSGAEAAKIEVHISDCARCQTIVASIAHAEESAAPAQVSRGWRWLLEVRLIAPALAGIIAIIVLARAFRNSVTQTETREQLALNTSSQFNPPPESQVQPGVSVQPSAAQRHAKAAPAEVPRQPQSAKPAAPRHRSAAAREATERLAPSASAGAEQPGQAQTSPPIAAAESASESTAPTTGTSPQWSTQIQASAPRGQAPTSAPVGGGAAAAISGAMVPVEQAYRSRVVETPDRSVTWIVGSRGSITRRDPTLGMRSETSGVSTDLTSGSAVSSQICWIVGRSGTVLRTIDGEHWQVLPAPISEDLIAVNAQSADSAEVIAQSGARFTTADGGKTWHRQ